MTLEERKREELVLVTLATFKEEHMEDIMAAAQKGGGQFQFYDKKMAVKVGSCRASLSLNYYPDCSFSSDHLTQLLSSSV